MSYQIQSYPEHPHGSHPATQLVGTDGLRVGRSETHSTMFDPEAWLNSAVAPDRYPPAVRPSADIARPVVTNTATLRTNYETPSGQDLKFVFTPEHRGSQICRVMEWDPSLVNPSWVLSLPGGQATGRFRTVEVLTPTLPIAENYDLVMWNGWMGKVVTTSAAIANGGTASASLSNDPHDLAFSDLSQLGADGIVGMVCNNEPALEGIRIGTCFSGDAEFKPPIRTDQNVNKGVITNSADVRTTKEWARQQGQGDGNGWQIVMPAGITPRHPFDTNRFADADFITNLTGDFLVSFAFTANMSGGGGAVLQFKLHYTTDDGLTSTHDLGVQSVGLNAATSFNARTRISTDSFVIRMYVEITGTIPGATAITLEEGSLAVIRDGVSYGEGLTPLTYEVIFSGMDPGQSVSASFYGTFTAVPNRELSKFVTSFTNHCPVSPYLNVSTAIFAGSLAPLKPVMNAKRAEHFLDHYEDHEHSSYLDLMYQAHNASGFSDFFKGIAHGLGDVLSTGSSLLAGPAAALSSMPGTAGKVASGVAAAAPLVSGLGALLQKAEGYDMEHVGLTKRARRQLNAETKRAVAEELRKAHVGKAKPSQAQNKKKKKKNKAAGRQWPRGSCWFPSVADDGTSAVTLLSVTTGPGTAPVTQAMSELVSLTVGQTTWMISKSLVGDSGERCGDVMNSIALINAAITSENASPTYVVVTVPETPFDIAGPSWGLALVCAYMGSSPATAATGEVGPLRTNAVGNTFAAVMNVSNLPAKAKAVAASPALQYLRPFTLGVDNKATPLRAVALRGGRLSLVGVGANRHVDLASDGLGEEVPAVVAAEIPVAPVVGITEIIAAYPREALEALAASDLAPVLASYLASLNPDFSNPAFAESVQIRSIADYPTDPPRQVLAQILYALAGIAGIAPQF